jgi:hypothetical protein
MVEEYKLLTEAYDGGQLDHQEYKAKAFGTGLYVTISRLMISIPYENHIIELVNEFGLSNTAKVEMKIQNGTIPDFEISNRSHLMNLFSINKQYLIVKSNNAQTKLFLEKALDISGMKTIAKENLFEPKIKTERIDGSLFIKTEYHLQLTDKIGAAKALIDFHIEIIDNL